MTWVYRVNNCHGCSEDHKNGCLKIRVKAGLSKSNARLHWFYTFERDMALLIISGEVRACNGTVVAYFKTSS
jgi:hypothetical protein